MSADNWDTCPKCKSEDAGEAEQNFRENYELGFLNQRFFVDYLGECTKCGYVKSFTHADRNAVI